MVTIRCSGAEIRLPSFQVANVHYTRVSQPLRVSRAPSVSHNHTERMILHHSEFDDVEQSGATHTISEEPVKTQTFSLFRYVHLRYLSMRRELIR